MFFFKFLGKSQHERSHKRGSYKAKECTLAIMQLAVSVLLILL